LVTRETRATAGAVRKGDLSKLDELKNFYKIKIDREKFDYIFGKVKSGSQHNIDRSKQLATVMKQLGVNDDLKGQQLLREYFTKIAKDDKNISNTFEKVFREGGKGKFLVKESLFAGPSGKFAKFETTWEIMQDNTLRLTTIIPKL
jgi:hypothetical protein